MGNFQFRFADSDETVMSVTDLFVSSTGNFHIITLERRLSHREQMVFVSTPRCGQGFRFRSPWILSVVSGAATFLHPHRRAWKVSRRQARVILVSSTGNFNINTSDHVKLLKDDCCR